MALTPYDFQLPLATYWPEVQDKLHDVALWRPPTSLVNVLGLIGTISLIYLVAYLLNRPKRISGGEDAMTRYFRNEHVKFLLGEGITDMVEDWVHHERISRGDAMDIYYKIGHAFGLDGLIQRKPPKIKLSKGQADYLKEQISQRVNPETLKKHRDKKTNVVELKRPLGSKLKRGA